MTHLGWHRRRNSVPGDDKTPVVTDGRRGIRGKRRGESRVIRTMAGKARHAGNGNQKGLRSPQALEISGAGNRRLRRRSGAPSGLSWGIYGRGNLAPPGVAATYIH